MPVRTPPLALAALALGLTAGCAAVPPDTTPPPSAPVAVDPPAADTPTAEPDDVAAAPVVSAPVEVSLTIPAATMPDGTVLEIVVRSVEAGDRREVTMDTPEGVVDRHVIDGDRHWWWIPPTARPAVGGVEWIHLDVREVAEVGELPDLVADARVRLPRPGELAVGQVVAGRQVRSIDRVGPGEDRVHLDGLPEPAVVRVRPLPAGTRIDLPEEATELADLPEVLAR